MSNDDLAVWTEAADKELLVLVSRYQNASGILMKIANFVGSKTESALNAVPEVRDLIAKGTTIGLRNAYSVSSTVRGASIVPNTGSWANKVGVVVSGAAGGFAGLAGTIVEIPATVTMILGAIQRVAAKHGFDTADERVKMECLAVFASGGPLREDDDAELAFFAHRFAVNGVTVSALINAVAPKLAALIGQKLASQAVPVLGAVSGAAVNYAFISYFEEMAEVRFGLRKLGASFGSDRVAEQFRLSVLEARQNKKSSRLV